MVVYVLKFRCKGPEEKAQAPCLVDTPFLNITVSKTLQCWPLQYHVLDHHRMTDVLDLPNRYGEEFRVTKVYTGLCSSCFKALYPTERQRETMLRPVNGHWTSIVIQAVKFQESPKEGYKGQVRGSQYEKPYVHYFERGS